MRNFIIQIIISAVILVFVLAVISGSAAFVSASDFVEHLIDDSFDYYIRPSVVDLDGDGDLDVVVAVTEIYPSEGGLFWYENNGNAPPSFTRHPIRTEINLAHHAVGDLDGDGDLDIVSATGDVSTPASDLAWSENRGVSPLCFETHTIREGQYDWRDVFVADVNGDGTTDVLAANTINDLLAWYEYTPGTPPTFSERIIRPEEDDYWGISVADLNGDGTLDVINHAGTFPRHSQELSWYENRGGLEPTFIQHFIGSGREGRAVFSADINQDGDVDIFVGYRRDNRLVWYENNGASDPVFTEIEIDTPDLPFDINVADIDRNGTLDLLVGSGSSYSLAWYSNDGGSPPVFTRNLVPDTPFINIGLAPADLDGDNDVDIVSSNFTVPKLVWFENLINQSPVANAGEDSESECTSLEGAMITLDGSGSTDPDSTPGTNDDIILFEWFEDFGLPSEILLGTGEILYVAFSLGTHVITLQVTDSQDATDTDEVLKTIVDTTPPEINCPEDVFKECESASQAYVNLPLASATDLCCETVTITNNYTPNGPDASGSYPVGATTVTFTACDESDNCSTCQTVVTVLDTIPPEISVSVDPDELWPPNHRMVDVEAFVIANDICGTATVILESITSSEPDDVPGGGDGHTINDIQDADYGTADFNFKLRAERIGSDDGRAYLITYSATDQYNNSASANSYVNVPHDKDGVTEPINLSLQETTMGTLVEWNSVIGAEHYNVIRGLLGNINESESAIDLGDVICIKGNSLNESTERYEDYEVPETGEAFFYLVEYYDGLSSSYGTESASKPRETQSGKCQ